MTKESICSKFLSFGILLLILASVSEMVYLWEEPFLKIIWARRFFLIPAFLCLSISVILNRFNFKDLKFDYFIFTLGLLYFFLTNWLYNNYGLIQAPATRSIILFFSLISAVILIKVKRVNFNWSLITIVSIFSFIIIFLIQADGRIIFSDDHSTFLHRLMLLKDNFPNIPIYDPFWNGGYDQRYFFATGVLNLYFLVYPLIKFFNPADVYNYCVVFVVFVLPPLSLYLSSKVLKLSSDVAWIASLLSLATGYYWYKWCLQYGTLGFVIATILLPLNLVLFSKFLNTKDKFSLIYSMIFVITFSLMLFWSLSGIVFVPLILVGIYKIFKENLLAKNNCILISVLLLIINLPWVLSFWSISNVNKFLAQENVLVSDISSQTISDSRVNKFRHKKKEFNLEEAINDARIEFSRFNPILIIFFIPGIFLLAKEYRFAFISTSMWLLFLGTIMVKIKPQLELDRMLVMLFMLACIPSALSLNKVFAFSFLKFNFKSFVKICLVSLTIGFLIASQFSVATIIRNRTTNNYYFKSDFSEKLENSLASYSNSNFRALFSGCVIHEIDGGHIAPIPQLAKMPVVVSSPVHNLWWYKQIFPIEYLNRGDEGKEEYLDLYNAGIVFAHEENWKSYFLSLPEKYKYIKDIDAFSLFERINYTSSYFYKGDGKVLEQKNSSVKLQLATNEAVIKFNYFDFLESDFCKLEEYKISESVKFIKIKDCQEGQILTIKSKPIWKRIKLF